MCLHTAKNHCGIIRDNWIITHLFHMKAFVIFIFDSREDKLIIHFILLEMLFIINFWFKRTAQSHWKKTLVNVKKLHVKKIQSERHVNFRIAWHMWLRCILERISTRWQRTCSMWSVALSPLSHTKFKPTSVSFDWRLNVMLGNPFAIH